MNATAGLRFILLFISSHSSLCCFIQNNSRRIQLSFKNKRQSTFRCNASALILNNNCCQTSVWGHCIHYVSTSSFNATHCVRHAVVCACQQRAGDSVEIILFIFINFITHARCSPWHAATVTLSITENRKALVCEYRRKLIGIHFSLLPKCACMCVNGALFCFHQAVVVAMELPSLIIS